MKKYFLLTVLLINSVYAEDQVDYVSLGAMLLKDGYIERAKTALEKVDVTKEDFDFKRFYTLKGILYHRIGYPLISNIFFSEAVKRGQDNPAIMLYVARNHWQLNNYAEVIDALDKAGDTALENPQMLVIKAEAYKLQGKIEEAWAVLDQGISLYPEFSRFYRQKFYYLMELGFYRHALSYAQQYLKSIDYSIDDYLAIAYALRENNQYDLAAELLEQALLTHDSDEKLVELLGQVYIDQEKYLMAASVFDWASIKHPKFAYKAATLYLKAGQPIRTLQLNRRIVSQKDKFLQRLSIDIYLDNYESVVAKVPALARYGLLNDDEIIYAVGYGYYKIGEFDKAIKYLKKITDSQVFAKASRIFQQIEKCKGEPVVCL